MKHFSGLTEKLALLTKTTEKSLNDWHLVYGRKTINFLNLAHNETQMFSEDFSYFLWLRCLMSSGQSVVSSLFTILCAPLESITSALISDPHRTKQPKQQAKPQSALFTAEQIN